MSEKPLPFMETFSMNVISCSLYPPNHKHLPMEGCQFFQNPEGQAQVLSLVDCLCEFLSSILKILLQSYLEGLNNGSSITQKHKWSTKLVALYIVMVRKCPSFRCNFHYGQLLPYQTIFPRIYNVLNVATLH